MEDLFAVEEKIVVVEEEIVVQEEAVAENNVEEAVVNDTIVAATPATTAAAGTSLRVQLRPGFRRPPAHRLLLQHGNVDAGQFGSFSEIPISVLPLFSKGWVRTGPAQQHEVQASPLVQQTLLVRLFNFS